MRIECRSSVALRGAPRFTRLSLWISLAGLVNACSPLVFPEDAGPDANANDAIVDAALDASAVDVPGVDGGSLDTDAAQLNASEDAAVDAGEDAALDATEPDSGVPLVSLEIVHLGTGTGTVTSQPAGIACGAACQLSLPLGTRVRLTATPDDQSDFMGWSEASCGANVACELTLDRARLMGATFTLKTHRLVVTKSGDGDGRVTSMPGLIDCDPLCVDLFSARTMVTLTAMADATSGFGGWSGACSGLTPTCSVAMTSARTVNAAFDRDRVTLSISELGDGGGTVTASDGSLSCPGTCSASYAVGTMVTLTAVADATSVFNGWGGACSGTGPCTVNLASAASVTATFGAARVHVTKAGLGGGSVFSSPSGIACDPTCDAVFTAGDMVSLAAVPDTQSNFAGWSGDCTGMSSCALTMDGEKDVTATFEQRRYRLDVSTSGDGMGTVTSMSPGISCGSDCTEVYVAGSIVTLTAMTGSGSTFGGWSGACQGSGTSCTVTMDAAKTVGAAFDRLLYSLSISPQGTGTGVVSSSDGQLSCPPQCAHSYPSGTNVTLTALADATTSVFAGWGGACGGTGPCAVTMNASTPVIATFARTELTIDITGASTGTVRVSPTNLQCSSTCSAPVSNGTVVTLTATPDGYTQFDGWGGDCTGTGPCVLTILGPRTVTANFRPPNPPVTNGQAASLVLGQELFTTADINHGGESLASLNGPRACATDGTRLWVADAANGRILQWNTMPTLPFRSADLVIGQPSATAHTYGRTQSTLNQQISGVSVYNGQIWISDSNNSRVIEWGAVPSASGSLASFVSGHTDFTGFTQGTAQNQYYTPYSARIAAGHLFVADAVNNRVLIFNSIPSSTGYHTADVVLGQPNFTTRTVVSPPTASSIANPFDVWFDPTSNRLFVADTGNHRVLVWNGIPTNTVPADYILGQPSMTLSQIANPPSASTLYSPRGVVVAQGSLFVADGANNRVLVWTPIPTSGSPSGTAAPPATRVLGQSDFVSNASAVATSARLSPWGLCSDGQRLFVADTFLNRVLAFTLSP